MQLTLEFDREEDGRWIGSVLELPGVLAYGDTREQALAKMLALAYTTLADEVEHGERDPRSLLSLAVHAPEAA
ncbi:MAG: type II toxin-antitoxin system HicB family antitoxin [Polyangiaceae bacterium]|jgi:predicted RNase H-like HicB family nuclease